MKPHVVVRATECRRDEAAADERRHTHAPLPVRSLEAPEWEVVSAGGAAVVRGVHDQHVIPHALALEQARQLACKKRSHSFLSFRYVCPDPVLVK